MPSLSCILLAAHPMLMVPPFLKHLSLTSNVAGLPMLGNLLHAPWRQLDSAGHVWSA